MNIKILIAAHKQYPMPKDSIYLPIHVGKEGKNLDLGFIGDNTGENISKKNANFCELTALYWAHKNLEADYIGLAHYRRHFSLHRKGDKFASILTTEEAQSLLKDHDIILPKKRNYYIETVHSQYIHAHQREGLDLIPIILQKDYPAYLDAWNNAMNRTSTHLFNMFIMKKEYFDAYITWLFDILFQVEAKLDISTYTPHEARVFGFLSERLLDVWLEANSLTYKEINVLFMESQNWVKKGFEFLKRKFSQTPK